MTADGALLDSSALPLLRDLEARGCRLTVTADGGRLIVKPASRLTGEERARVREHRHALATLIRVRDDGVQERLVAFEQQFREAPGGTTPDCVFRRGTSYAKGVCFSCGDQFGEARYGRCWRCSLAWRMAVGVPIPAERAAANDGARVVA